jgi:hypothetical protein
MSFSPTDISNLELWLDATDADTVHLTDSKVSQWDDKSGKNRTHTQGSADYRPTVSSAAIGGKDAVQFTAANATFLATDDSQTGLSSLVGSTLFLVVQQGSNSLNQCLWGPSNTWSSTIFNWGGMQYWWMNNSDEVNVAKPDITYPRILGMYWDASQSVSLRGWGFCEGKRVTPTTGTHSTQEIVTGLTVGASGGGSNPFQGIISEVLYYSKALSDTEFGQVMAYLDQKYGLKQYLYTHMGSNSVPSPLVASASSEYESNLAWKAFDYDGSTFWESTNNVSEGNPAWLKLDFGATVTARGYDLINGTSDNLTPKTWKLETSLDNSEWTERHSVSNDTNTTANTSRAGAAYGYDFGSDVSFRYARITVTDANGGGQVIVARLVFYGPRVGVTYDESLELSAAAYDTDAALGIFSESTLGLAVASGMTESSLLSLANSLALTVVSEMTETAVVGANQTLSLVTGASGLVTTGEIVHAGGSTYSSLLSLVAHATMRMSTGEAGYSEIISFIVSIYRTQAHDISISREISHDISISREISMEL